MISNHLLWYLFLSSNASMFFFISLQSYKGTRIKNVRPIGGCGIKAALAVNFSLLHSTWIYLLNFLRPTKMGNLRRMTQTAWARFYKQSATKPLLMNLNAPILPSVSVEEAFSYRLSHILSHFPHSCVNLYEFYTACACPVHQLWLCRHSDPNK